MCVVNVWSLKATRTTKPHKLSTSPPHPSPRKTKKVVFFLFLFFGSQLYSLSLSWRPLQALCSPPSFQRHTHNSIVHSLRSDHLISKLGLSKSVKFLTFLPFVLLLLHVRFLVVVKVKMPSLWMMSLAYFLKTLCLCLRYIYIIALHIWSVCV